LTPPDLEDDEELATGTGEVLEVELAEPAPRLDKALATAIRTLSRARLQALMAEGAVTFGERALTDASAKAEPGLYRVRRRSPRPSPSTCFTRTPTSSW
jgi:23S rRNA pseudouridine1911/1915/1917 synthase